MSDVNLVEMVLFTAGFWLGVVIGAIILATIYRLWRNRQDRIYKERMWAAIQSQIDKEGSE